MLYHQKSCREICRQLGYQVRERFQIAIGGSNYNDVTVRHGLTKFLTGWSFIRVGLNGLANWLHAQPHALR